MRFTGSFQTIVTHGASADTTASVSVSPLTAGSVISDAVDPGLLTVPVCHACR
jgi:hypothetical protein